MSFHYPSEMDALDGGFMARLYNQFAAWEAEGVLPSDLDIVRGPAYREYLRERASRRVIRAIKADPSLLPLLLAWETYSLTAEQVHSHKDLYADWLRAKIHPAFWEWGGGK